MAPKNGASADGMHQRVRREHRRDNLPVLRSPSSSTNTSGVYSEMCSLEQWASKVNTLPHELEKAVQAFGKDLAGWREDQRGSEKRLLARTELSLRRRTNKKIKRFPYHVMQLYRIVARLLGTVKQLEDSLPAQRDRTRAHSNSSDCWDLVVAGPEVRQQLVRRQCRHVHRCVQCNCSQDRF